MNQPLVCASCHAPLQPGALKCGYCQAPTPLAAEQAAYQQRMAAHQQRVAADNASRQHFANIATAQSSANLGLILAIVGMPICCAPISIAGGVLGARAVRLAKVEQVAAPVRAFVSMVVAGISTLTSISVLLMYMADTRAHQKRLEGVQARLEGKREAVTIDAKVACDLAEERLLEDGFDGSKSLEDVTCEGPLELAADHGALKNVRATIVSKRHLLNACLSRGSRWFVVKLIEGGECGASAAPIASGGKALSEAELRAQEKKARADNQSAESQATVQSFTERLVKIRDRMPKPAELKEGSCPAAEIKKLLPSGVDRLKLATVDFEYLDRRTRATGAAAQRWAWLTSDRVKTILGEGGSATEKAKALGELRREGGPLLVVYRAEEKHWPEVHEKEGIIGTKVSYAAGEYAGWMMVWNLDSGERLCQAKLAFESGDDITYKKRGVSSEKTRALDAVEDDFKDRFEDAATAALKRVGPDLRLGYKILE